MVSEVVLLFPAVACIPLHSLGNARECKGMQANAVQCKEELHFLALHIFCEVVLIFPALACIPLHSLGNARECKGMEANAGRSKTTSQTIRFECF